ncbi:MAG: tetratricopeptide repeat protein [Acidobacteria bacterium]|nr:tetratricopeptide repeat protein [Acidobacteriota bacterium]
MCYAARVVSLAFAFPVLVTVIAGPAAAQAPAEPDSPARAEAYARFMIGRHLEGLDDTEGAVRAFREAARLDPAAGEPLAELAALYARAGRADDAMDTAEEALAREPDNRSAHRVLGLAYAAAASTREGTREEVDLAVEHLERARGSVVPDLQVELTLARFYLRAAATDEAIGLLEELSKDQLAYALASVLLAEAYQQAGRHDEALRTLEEAVGSTRPTYRMLARLGELYEQARRWRDAAEAYRGAVALNPRSAGVRRRLAAVLLEGDEAARARDVLEGILEMRPRDTASYHMLAEVEIALTNFDAAESAARRLIELEPDGLRGPYVLSQVFERRHEYQRVVETLAPVLERARAMRPQRLLAEMLDQLGRAYQWLEDPQGATQVYEDAVSLMPTSPGFQARLAQAYVDGERHDDAARLLARARDASPRNLTLAIIEADLYGRRGNLERGEDLLVDLLAENRDVPRAHLALASFYSEHDRLREALLVLESAQQQFPGETSILFLLGAVLEQSDRFADAERAFRRVLDRDPEHAQALNYLGYMLADRGERLDESVALIARAVERDPHNGSYLDSLGWAYFKLDRLDLAEPPLRAAGDQLQRNSVVQDHLGDLLHRLGRYDEAIAAWRRALDGDGEEIDPAAIERKIRDAQRRLDR